MELLSTPVQLDRIIHTHTQTHTHIYIYMCVCVCVCVCVCLGTWHINPCMLFNAKSIFIQINSSISNNSV